MKAKTVRRATRIALLGMVLFGVYPCFFHRPKLKAVFRVENASADTTFANPIWKYGDGFGQPISLRVQGEADDSTGLFITGPESTHRFFAHSIPGGEVDTTGYGEYYEKKMNITFLHKRAKRGRLAITFRYRTPDRDTLGE